MMKFFYRPYLKSYFVIGFGKYEAQVEGWDSDPTMSNMAL